MSITDVHQYTSHAAIGRPSNPALTVKGACDCRTDDFDNDGVLDCLDQCFANPPKTVRKR